MAQTLYDPKTNQYTNPQFAAPNAPGYLVDANINDIANSTITSDSLKPVTPLKLPPAPTTSVADSIIATTGQKIDTISSDLAKATETAKQAKDSSLKDFSTTLNELLGTTASRADLEANANIPELSKMSNEAFTALQASQRAQKKTIENIYNNPSLTREQANQQVSEINRKFALEQADLSINYDVANRNYTSAQATIDRKLELALEPLKYKLDAYKFIYSENKDAFTTAEKRQYEALIRNEERTYNEEKSNKESINNILLEAAKNGASQSVLSQISNSTSANEALIAGSKYMSNPIDNAIKYKQLEKLNQEIKAGNITLNNPVVQGSTQELAQKMMNSATQKSDLSQSEREKLAKMSLVIDQLDTLQSSISSSNKTGILKGRVNNILANLGANPDAGYINAQLQALIPNVARGIYGEVGVLTNADVENYKKTLPNITTVKQQNDLVLAMTLKNAVNSYENALKSAVNSNINVSGWTQDYLALKKQVADVEDRAGVTKVKVDNFYASNPDLQPMIDELILNGADDRDILTIMGIE